MQTIFLENIFLGNLYLVMNKLTNIRKGIVISKGAVIPKHKLLTVAVTSSQCGVEQTSSPETLTVCALRNC